MERKKGWLTSGAFAALCGTTKETLRHYKDVGLLLPAHQGDNGYFYYDVSPSNSLTGRASRCSRSNQAVRGIMSGLDSNSRLCRAPNSTKSMCSSFCRSASRRTRCSRSSSSVLAVFCPWRQRRISSRGVPVWRKMTPEASEDEALIVVLERCRALCSQYGIQTDFQLGAIHQPGEQGGPGAISHLYTRIKEKADFPYYKEKPAGNYLYLCCRGRWDISAGYAALNRCILERGLETIGDFYACDLAGFILNSVEKNAASMISVRLLDSVLTR